MTNVDDLTGKRCGDCKCKEKDLDCGFDDIFYCTNLNSEFCGIPVFNDEDACENFVEEE